MLTEKPLTRSEQWAEHKAEQRAERLGRKAMAAGLMYMTGAGLSVASPPLRPMNGRVGRRAARRPNRKQGGRSAVHVDRGLFNIATGRHEPLPRT